MGTLRWPKAFNDRNCFDPLGKYGGIFADDVAAKAMTKEREAAAGRDETEHEGTPGYSGPLMEAMREASDYKLPRQQRAFLGRVGRAMMEAIQVIGKSQ